MNRRVTLSVVASKAGVSVATASAVLSGKAGQSIRVSDSRRRVVLRAASSLGYVPNAAAQHLKTGDDNHIIAVFTYENIFPSDPRSEYYLFFAGIQQEAEREGYDILILNNWGQDKSRSSRIRLASGAIMIGVMRDDEHIVSLMKQDYPLVFVGRREIGHGRPVHCVTFGYEEAVDSLVEILSRRFDRIAYVSSSLSAAEPSEDKSAYLHAACKRRSITVVDIPISDSVTPSDATSVISAGAVIFDRFFILDLFTPIFQERGIYPGHGIFGAVLEDDWPGTHGEWTAWENRRLELGSLSARHLISFLSGSREEQGIVPIPILESESTRGL